MQFVLPIIALLILGVAEISMNTSPTPTQKPEADSEQNSNITPEVKTETENSSDTITKTEENITIAVTVKPTQKNNEEIFSKNYLYPEATLISESTNKVLLESKNSTQEITEWYKSYIQDNQMNTTSFVTTNSNNNVLNKLAGSGNGKSISIEIQKNENEDVTHITILLN